MKKILLAVVVVLCSVNAAVAQTDSAGIPVGIIHNGVPLGKDLGMALVDNLNKSGLFHVVTDGTGLVDISMVSVVADNEKLGTSAAVSFLIKVYRKTDNDKFTLINDTHIVVVVGKNKINEMAGMVLLDVQKFVIDTVREAK